MPLIEIDQNIVKQYKNEEIRAIRAKAYEKEADPLYLKVQRGEATQEEWLAKIEEIRTKHPYIS